MYYIRLTKINNKKQTDELILATKNKNEACLAFEGTLVGLHYELNNKQLQEKVTNNKVQIKYEDIMIILTLKEK